MFWSSRGQEKDVDLQPPFDELPFDSFIQFVEGEEETTLNSFCKLEKMAKQSRPL